LQVSPRTGGDKLIEGKLISIIFYTASLSDKTEYSYFFRTIPTDLIFTDAMLTFVANQGWPTIGILFSGDTFGKQRKNLSQI
jgi:ABC-type branched-subunit amino acid transport system substrate-binding protein